MYTLKSLLLKKSVFLLIVFSQSVVLNGSFFQKGTVGYEVYLGPGILYFCMRFFKSFKLLITKLELEKCLKNDFDHL